MIIRDTLTANRTYYVRTDGNDNNNGLTNDTTGAFLTIQKAIDVVCNTIDNMGYNVIIQVADGAYNASLILKPYVGSGSVTLSGNPTIPANVTITLSSGSCISALNGSQIWHITGFKLSTTGSGGNCIVTTASKVSFAAIDFGACVQNHILADGNSYLFTTGGYTISGGGVTHISLQAGSYITLGAYTVTLTGTPAFSNGFLLVYLCASLWSFATFSGSATGRRYFVATNAAINTNGSGANYFPGNTAGSLLYGGQYI